jgi:hypothetical protein
MIKSHKILVLLGINVKTDAVAWSSAKWNIGVRMSSSTIFRKEAFRLERFGIREIVRISVKEVSYNHNSCSGRGIVSTF